MSEEKTEQPLEMLFRLYPKQYEFFTSKQREVLLSGGFGSGKSLVLCLKLLQQASIKGNVCLLVRKYLTTLRKSTLRLLLEDEGERGALLPKGSYSHNKLERKIELNGGGTILYTGCDDPLSIRSVNCGDVFIDEASELSDVEYQELLFRLRIRVGGLQLFCVTNPANKLNYLYQRFEVNKTDERRIIYSSSFDNKSLPDSNIAFLNDLTGDARDKFVEGKWTDSEKLVYPNFSFSNNVIPISRFFTKYVIAVDFGYTNPTAIVVSGITGDGEIYLFREFYKRRMLISDITAKILEFIKKLGDGADVTILVDPSAASLIAECQSQGIEARKGDNDVEIEITRVRDYIDRKRMLVDTNCLNIIKELSNYTYEDNGKVIKKDDHACDAIRYIVNYMAQYGADEALTGKVYVF